MHIFIHKLSRWAPAAEFTDDHDLDKRDFPVSPFMSENCIALKTESSESFKHMIIDRSCAINRSRAKSKINIDTDRDHPTRPDSRAKRIQQRSSLEHTRYLYTLINNPAILSSSKPAMSTPPSTLRNWSRSSGLLIKPRKTFKILNANPDMPKMPDLKVHTQADPYPEVKHNPENIPNYLLKKSQVCACSPTTELNLNSKNNSRSNIKKPLQDIEI